MTAWNGTSTASRPAGPIVSSLDRAVTRIRTWLEDRLPWYDRVAEQQADARTEAIRQKSIQARIHNEAVIAEQRLKPR